MPAPQQAAEVSLMRIQELLESGDGITPEQVTTILDNLTEILAEIDNIDDTVSALHGLYDDQRKVTKTVTLTGAAGAGAVGTVAVFNVTGVVELTGLFGRITEDLVGGNIFLGVVGNTTLFSTAQDADLFDVGEFWPSGAVAPPVGFQTNLASVGGILGANVILSISGTDVTDGTVVFYLTYIPLSGDGLVEAA